MEEFIEEINWDDKVIAVHPKEKLKEKIFPHRAALIIPLTPEGKLILCKRAKDKYPYPNMWCCAVGGKVLVGETYEQAARREMKEEVGLTVDLQFVASFPYKEEEYPAIFYIFTTKQSIQKDAFTLDQTEIQFAEEFSREEVRKLIIEQPNLFAPTFRRALEVFMKEFPKPN